MKELPDEVIFLALPVEDSFNPKILSADVGAEILPLWIIRVGRRLDRIGANMAKAAGHSDTIGAHEMLVVIVGRVGVIAYGVPVFGRFLIEVWVGKEAQANDSGFIAIK